MHRVDLVREDGLEERRVPVGGVIRLLEDEVDVRALLELLVDELDVVLSYARRASVQR